MAKLKVVSRDIAGKKVKNLRNDGLVPAILFGPDFDSTMVAIDEKEFRSVFGEAGYSALVDVETPEGKKEKVVFKEIQEHPISDEIIHVSMYVIDPKKPITADIPLGFVGQSQAEKDNLGFVAYGADTITVRCLPKDLPASLEVDLSKLDSAEATILVNEVTLPDGVELDSKEDPNGMVASIAQAQKIEDVLEEIAGEEGEEGAEGEEGEAAEGEGAEAGEETAGEKEE